MRLSLVWYSLSPEDNATTRSDTVFETCMEQRLDRHCSLEGTLVLSVEGITICIVLSPPRTDTLVWLSAHCVPWASRRHVPFPLLRTAVLVGLAPRTPGASPCYGIEDVPRRWAPHQRLWRPNKLRLVWEFDRRHQDLCVSWVNLDFDALHATIVWELLIVHSANNVSEVTDPLSVVIWRTALAPRRSATSVRSASTSLTKLTWVIVSVSLFHEVSTSEHAAREGAKLAAHLLCAHTSSAQACELFCERIVLGQSA